MLTQANVRQFRNLLKETLVICDQMIQSREIEKLFTSEKDYRDSKIACEIVPDNFYKVRLFDELIELRFNNRVKQYYIYVECKNLPFSLNEINKESVFKKVFESVDRPSQQFFHFVFIKSIDLDKAVFYFKEFLRYYLYKSKNDLIPDIF